MQYINGQNRRLIAVLGKYNYAPNSFGRKFWCPKQRHSCHFGVNLHRQIPNGISWIRRKFLVGNLYRHFALSTFLDPNGFIHIISNTHTTSINFDCVCMGYTFIRIHESLWLGALVTKRAQKFRLAWIICIYFPSTKWIRACLYLPIYS